MKDANGYVFSEKSTQMLIPVFYDRLYGMASWKVTLADSVCCENIEMHENRCFSQSNTDQVPFPVPSHALNHPRHCGIAMVKNHRFRRNRIMCLVF